VGVHAKGGWTPTPAQVESLTGSAQFVAFAMEHARIQGELRQLSRAVEQSPASVMITEADGTIVYVNPRFTTLTGYSTEEALGKNPRILKSGQTPPETYREMWAALTAGRDWRGEFVNRKKSGDFYWELASISPIVDAQGRVSRYVCVKEDISAIKETEEELRQLSQTDPLTGLLNRRGFFTFGEQQIRIADRLRRPVHLVYIDVDRLKPVNDVFGHSEGDRLLREAGTFLRLMFRSSDVLARIGGDEFAALLIETAEGADENLVQRLQEKLGSLNRMSDRPYPISLSVGVAIRPPRSGITLEAFVEEADAAMYERKKRSRPAVPAT
jgi:diguanylate cyclase (GGDEF)-like protein/PAS domain S-box-containing protein